MNVVKGRDASQAYNIYSSAKIYPWIYENKVKQGRTSFFSLFGFMLMQNYAVLSPCIKYVNHLGCKNITSGMHFSTVIDSIVLQAKNHRAFLLTNLLNKRLCCHLLPMEKCQPATGGWCWQFFCVWGGGKTEGVAGYFEEIPKSLEEKEDILSLMRSIV